MKIMKKRAEMGVRFANGKTYILGGMHNEKTFCAYA